MHNCQDIEENRCFSNGGTNLHIHAIAQGRPEDNQVEFLQGPHGIVNPPKNLVLNNIRRFTQMANGLIASRCRVSGEPGRLFEVVVTRAHHDVCRSSVCMSISLLGRTCEYLHLDGHAVSIVRRRPAIVWPVSAPSEPLTEEHRLRCEKTCTNR